MSYTKILEVNLFAFASRLFHEDFSTVNGALHDTQPLVIPEQIWTRAVPASVDTGTKITN